MRFRAASRSAGRAVLTLALRDRDCLRPAQYLFGNHARELLLFRSGRFARDVDPVVSADLGPPAHLCCPDCGVAVISEDADEPVSVRQFHVMLHRICSCASLANVSNWYHDVAVRLVPTSEMAALLVGARRAEVLWAAGRTQEWESACIGFLRHLLSPMDICPRGDTLCCERMVAASHIFITHVDCDGLLLPDVSTYGDPPVINMRPLAEVSVRFDAADRTAFWQTLDCIVPPFVPPALALGHEAEAPWARPCRRSARLQRHGMVPD